MYPCFLISGVPSIAQHAMIPQSGFQKANALNSVQNNCQWTQTQRLVTQNLCTETNVLQGRTRVVAQQTQRCNIARLRPSTIERPSNDSLPPLRRRTILLLESTNCRFKSLAPIALDDGCERRRGRRWVRLSKLPRTFRPVTAAASSSRISVGIARESWPKDYPNGFPGSQHPRRRLPSASDGLSIRSGRAC